MLMINLYPKLPIFTEQITLPNYAKRLIVKKAGFPDNKELIDVLEKFYSQEKQNEFGVIGIEIKRI